MPLNETVVSRRDGSILNTHSVLRNTYLLLSLTLIFSAAMAGLAMANQASFGSSIVAFIVGFVLLFATTALRNSVWGIVAVFAFTGCMGYSMGPMLNQFIKGYS